MTDHDYQSAIERRYLAAHPKHAAWFAELTVEARATLMRQWPNTLDGQRFILAADLDRLADEDPAYAEALHAKAQALRDRLFTTT